jgi:hypothetical protein
MARAVSDVPARDHRLGVLDREYSGARVQTTDDALNMRDDVVGLAAIKTVGFQGVPVQTLSRTSASGKQTFANVLTRATTPVPAPPGAALPRNGLPAGTLPQGPTVPGTPPKAPTLPGTLPGATRPGTLPGATRPGTPPGATRPGTLPGATRPGTPPGATLPRATLPGTVPNSPLAGNLPKGTGVTLPAALPRPAASTLPRAATPSTALDHEPGASTALDHEPGASTALAQAPRPYVSPLKRPTVNAPAPPTRKPTPTTPHRAAPATPPSASRPPTTVDRPRPPIVAVPRPDAPVAADASTAAGALALGSYPHPDQDNGRGMHWIPTTKQTPADVDRFVAEAQRMGVKWVTFLNQGTAIGENDYLVTKLAAAGIEPVMRIFSDTLTPVQGDVEGMVRHYTGLGVHYFQPFNEPNLNCENPDGKVSVDRYLDAWIPAAKAIVRGGGLPGFGSMAPGGDYDDQKFLTAALDGLKARGEVRVLDKAWLSMHNYTWNHPINDRGDGDGFFKFRAYHKTVQAALGRDIPIIGTEGGSMVGEQEDARMAKVTPGMAADWTTQAFTYMRDKREPWMFASSVWTIADMAGGGSDPRFEAQALFKADGTRSAIVGSLQGLG